MPVRFQVAAAFLAVCTYAFSQQHSAWRLTRGEHFEIYSQAADETTHSALLWLEQLRAFFLEQTGFKTGGTPAVRVIGFRSAKEYEPYRLRTTSDAYYVGAEGRDYIVMALDPARFRIVAHEYAHLFLHSAKLELPPWLNEGLAELFSTVRVSERGSTLGGDLPGHSQALRLRPWIPLAQLLAAGPESYQRANRDNAAMFYAESWALTEMLILAPEYSPGFQTVMAMLTSGSSSSRALTTVYQKTPEEIETDARAWIQNRNSKAVPLPGVIIGAVGAQVSEVPAVESRLVLADLLLAAGELDRAETAYRELTREAPSFADVSAALGTIALRKGDAEGARREWKRAIEQGVEDAVLCFRYALLASAKELDAEEIRRALARAVALKPDFDDARFNLALLEKNLGRYEAALEHLRAMRNVAPARAFTYWIATADALNELGRRDEAKGAAQTAASHATTPAERQHASQLAYLAETDLAVQFTRDESGQPKMITTRTPHNLPNWNAFIEPGDEIHRVQGTLREINCDGAITQIMVRADGKLLKLTIPDPSRVQMRNAPAEFVCGRQRATPVTIEYAASKTAGSKSDGVVRGMEFQ